MDDFQKFATGTAGNDQLPQEEDALVLESTIDVPISDHDEFHGACIDSGAQITIIGSGQAEAYCRQHGGSSSPTCPRSTYRFANKRYRCTGYIRTSIPVSGSHVLDVKADAVDVEVPFLLRLDVLSDLNALLDVGNDKIVSPSSGWEVPLTQKRSHLYLIWPPTILFTVLELRKIYQHFFHAHPEKVFKVLRRFDPDATTGDDLVKLEKIRRECEVCQRICEVPRASINVCILILCP